eukprot:jgi/Psemu1/289404/fgenesh1_pg.354_\
MTASAAAILLLTLSSLSVVPIRGFSIPVFDGVICDRSAATRSPFHGLTTCTFSTMISKSGSRSIMLRSASGDGNDNEKEEDVHEEEEQKASSLWDTVNDFLDTPILDANNRSDQGAVAETLKEFVRDEPELAQVTFSAAVVAILVLGTRLVMS